MYTMHCLVSTFCCLFHLIFALYDYNIKSIIIGDAVSTILECSALFIRCIYGKWLCLPVDIGILNKMNCTFHHAELWVFSQYATGIMICTVSVCCQKMSGPVATMAELNLVSCRRCLMRVYVSPCLQHLSQTSVAVFVLARHNKLLLMHWLECEC